MPNIKSQMKRVKTNAIATASNNSKRSRVKNVIKKFNLAIEAKDQETAKSLYTEIVSLLDRAYYDGVYHKNTIARKKSTVAKLYNSIAE